MGKVSRGRRVDRRLKVRFIKKSKIQQRAGLEEGSKKSALKIGLLNVDHLSMASFHDVVATIQTEEPDVVFLLETFRTVEDSHEDVDIPQYKSFEALRSEAAEDKAGGGIIAFCKTSEGLNMSRYEPEIDTPDEQFVKNERIWVTVQNDLKKKTAICGVYMACQTSGDEYREWNELMYSRLRKEVASLQTKGFRVVMIGDFNGWVGNNLGEGGIPGNRPQVNANGRRFLEFLESVELIHINGATRIPGDWSTRLTTGLWTRQRGGSATILDYGVISREFLSSVICMVVDERGALGGGADHNWVFLSIEDNFTVKKRMSNSKNEVTVWDIKENQDWSSFSGVVSQAVDSVDMSSVFSVASGVSGCLLKGLKESIGTKVTGGRIRRVQLPRSLVEELKLRRTYEANYKSTVSDFVAEKIQFDEVLSAELLFKQQKLKVDTLVNMFKVMRRRESSLKCVGNSKSARKKFWSFISSRQKSGGISALIDPVSGVLKCEPIEVKVLTETFLCKLFKGSFSPIPQEDNGSVLAEEEVTVHDCHQDHPYSKPGGFPGGAGVPLAAPPPYSDHGYSRNPSPKLESVDNSRRVDTDPKGFLASDIKLEEVEVAVKELKTGKAVGWDKIPNEAIKNAGASFLLLLTILFNMIKDQCKLPKNWNVGRLVLVHKKGSVDDILNYRPLTVIISLCGLYSKILNARLVVVTETHKLLGEIQNGFRQARCCADNNFILNTILWKARALGKEVHCGYIDLFKA